MATAAARAGGADYRAVYGDLAYDYDYLAREHALTHAGERVPAGAVKEPRVRSVSQPMVRARQRVSVVAVLGSLAVAGMAVLLLLSYIRLTDLSSSVVALKAELATLQTENVSLSTRYEQTYDLTAVQAAATRAGMTKPSGSQIYYIDLSGADSATVYQKENAGMLSQILSSLNHGVYALVEYFD